jgi:hypothetical protein
VKYNLSSDAKRSYSAISLPFSINATGQVIATTDERKIWADRVLSVLGTNINERIFRSEFGTDIISSFFTNADSISTAVDREISRAFVKFLPNLIFVESTYLYDDFSGLVQIEVVYTLPNNNQDTVVLGSIYINKNAIINEVIL